MIVADGETVGHISLARRPRGWYETQIVIGERNYRDKGIGTRAIKLLLRRARRAGISRIYLEVRPDNLRAIRAYEKSGFVRDRYKQYRNKNLPETLRMVVAKTFGGGW